MKNKGFLHIIFILLVGFWYCSFSVQAQVQDSSSVIITDDGSEFVVLDSLVHDTASNGVVVVDVNHERKRNLHRTYFAPDPTKATMYALVCPGLGQIYNRSYWKVPIVYGGIVTLGYLISWNGRTYNDYKNAYHDIMDSDPNTRSYENMVASYSDSDKEWLTKTLKRKRDLYRRYRDMSIFGMVGLYVLSVLDAFVDAHLYDFTISNDLSMHVEPIIKSPYLAEDVGYSPSIYGLQCSVRF